MFFLTFCGGAEVRPRESDNIVITVWGGTDILMPTLAEKIVRIWKIKQEYGEVTDSVIRRTNVITLMGGTVFKSPTLASEIEEMHKLRESRMIPDSELLELFREALQRDDLDLFEALTIMGGAGDERPSIKEEIKQLQFIASRGLISAEECQELESMLNGRPGTAEIQEKVRSMLSPIRAASLPGSRPRLTSAGELES